MRHKSLQFKISQMRQDKIIYAIEAIAVIIFALFTSALLPTLLIRYVYANQQLFQQPKALEYIPIVAFVIGAGYFIYATIMMISKARSIKAMEAELADLELLGDGCGCGGNCGCGSHDDNWEDLEELEKLVEEAVAEAEKEEAATKKTKKKTAAASKKKTTTKKSKSTSKKSTKKSK